MLAGRTPRQPWLAGGTVSTPVFLLLPVGEDQCGPEDSIDIQVRLTKLMFWGTTRDLSLHFISPAILVQAEGRTSPLWASSPVCCPCPRLGAADGTKPGLEMGSGAAISEVHVLGDRSKVCPSCYNTYSALLLLFYPTCSVNVQNLRSLPALAVPNRPLRIG